MRLERYAGLYSAALNPSATAWNPQNWDISLFAADLHVDNNYLFLRDASVPYALRNSEQIVSVVDTGSELRLRSDAILADFFDRDRKMYGVLQARVGGPGFSLRIGERHVIGLSSALRTQVSSYGIPAVLRYRTINNLPRNQLINIPATRVAGMAWGEIALHYSYRNTDQGLHFALGVSPKYLIGLEGFYAQASSSFDYSQRQNDTVAFARAEWSYGLSTGNLTTDQTQVRLRQQGGGFGIDLGVSWSAPAADAETEEDYAWRAGLSLLDLGFVRFNRSAQAHAFRFDTLVAVSNANFPPRDDPNKVLQDVSQAFLGDSLASLQSKAFSMGLPLGLSAQVDVRLLKGLYLSGVYVQRIPLGKTALRRPTLLAVAPRYEHRWFSISTPLVLNEWQRLRVGLAARLGVLYIGTDNLGSWMSKGTLTGTDVYIAMKINAFSIRFGKEGRSRTKGGANGKRNWKKIKCYTF